ncbi:putative SCAN domain-containing protein SCAND2P [Simochromis diagramma]|uniref:putative SCAN domain-containing protein SCAND2P n=1 Tax=Simochromis diagramma TaxID=43689 RepID=UPI001A7E315D|nr:putative SCAN domain-containing protein SCAND2P [Simochromis diagramma]
MSGHSRRRCPGRPHFQQSGPGVCAAPRGFGATSAATEVPAGSSGRNGFLGLHPAACSVPARPLSLRRDAAASGLGGGTRALRRGSSRLGAGLAARWSSASVTAAVKSAGRWQRTQRAVASGRPPTNCSRTTRFSIRASSAEGPGRSHLAAASSSCREPMQTAAPLPSSCWPGIDGGNPPGRDPNDPAPPGTRPQTPPASRGAGSAPPSGLCPTEVAAAGRPTPPPANDRPPPWPGKPR